MYRVVGSRICSFFLGKLVVIYGSKERSGRYRGRSLLPPHGYNRRVYLQRRGINMEAFVFLVNGLVAFR